jgi:syntaxin-binding protein 5
MNPELLIPPRPTISNLQWIAGTQHVTPADMDLLIGGPDRPPSKRMLAQARSDELQQGREARPESAAGGAGAGAGSGRAYPGASGGPPSQEGWGAWANRQMQERTERLNIVGDSMNSLEQNSAGWASDVNKFVGKQKKSLVMGAIKGKFGL